MAQIMRWNFADLTKAERNRFVQAVLKMKKDGIYDWYVQTHIDSMWMLNDMTKPMPMWAHMRPAFLPWHRQFILDFENDMRAADEALTGKKPSDLALPYWDWINFRSPSSSLYWGTLWSDDFMGGDGDGSPDNKVTKGPFTGSAWPLTFDAGSDYQPFTQHGKPFLQRALGASKRAPTLPTEDEWTAARDLTSYDADTYWDSNVGRQPPTPRFAGVKSFRNALEGWIGYYPDAAAVAAATDPNRPLSSLHNRVHAWVGGSLGPLSSPNDPVFFLHHSNVDRLWAEWQAAHATLPDQYLPKDGVADVTDPDGEKDTKKEPEVIHLQGHHLTDPMPPWDGRPATRKGLTGNMPVRRPSDVLNHTSLGYRYFTDPPSLSATGTP